MSATVAAIAKKIAVMLATDKRTWKVIGTVIAMLLVIALLPVMVLLALGNSLNSVGSQEIDTGQFIQNLSPQQQAMFSQIETDGTAIVDELTRLGFKTEIVKAQMIYLTYFDDVPKDKNFFVNYCTYFKTANGNNESLIKMLNEHYGTNIDYNEFMRSYAVISNVSIDSNLFVNLEIKNNIDFAQWAENAYVTQWGFVPNTFGEVLSEEKYKELQEESPDEITQNCEKWKSRRTVDNIGLIYSYLWFNTENRKIKEDTKQTSIELYNSSQHNGLINTLPDTVGLVLINSDTIGIYIGNNEVIYAKSIDTGIVKENISQGNWTSWFELSQIQYGEEKNFNNTINFSDCYDPKIKNNLDLVKWAINAHNDGWGYVYGTYGNVLNESILQDRANMFGYNVTNYMDFIRQNWMGKRTADCVGLIKGYGWYDAETGNIIVGSNGMADVGANGMYQAATGKGTIDTMPDVPGLAVWHDGHIGIYIGNGEVIEAMNTLRGVTRTNLKGREWSHWLQIPYISYIDQ